MFASYGAWLGKTTRCCAGTSEEFYPRGQIYASSTRNSSSSWMMWMLVALLLYS